MKKLEIDFKNCFGIKRMKEDFNFENSKVQLIYAKKGSMKTSFSKIFENYKEGTQKEIKDKIFEESELFRIEGEDGWLNIKGNKGKIEDEPNDKNKNIFVIGGLNEKYQSNKISNLLLNDSLKNDFDHILMLRYDFLKKIRLKTKLAIPPRKEELEQSKLEEKFLRDFNFKGLSFLDSLDQIDIGDINVSDVEYGDIFDNGKLENLIESESFQNNIDNFIEKSEEIYGGEEYTYLSQEKFTFGKFQEVSDILLKKEFFEKNEIILDGVRKNKIALVSELENLKNEINSSDEFKKISEELNKTDKGKKLLSILESKSAVILELKNYKEFRKKLWYQYLSEKIDGSEKTDFEILKEKYRELKDKITDEDLRESKWIEAVRIFNDRFDMPFRMDIVNLKNSVFGDIPIVKFIFYKDGDKENYDVDNVTIKNKDSILETLSQGEKRALYLLNIIFDIENFKKELKGDPEREILFVIDDIADSFDYRNKYSIVEYLKEISEEPNFYSIILTHNFDFFRTLSSRFDLGINCEPYWRFTVETKDNQIKLVPTKKELTSPFTEWIKIIKDKQNGFEKYVIATIPLIRQLLKMSNRNSEAKTLHKIVHSRAGCDEVTLREIREIFQKFYNFEDGYSFGDIESGDKKINDLIKETVKEIVRNDDNSLLSKTILSLYIRKETERYLKSIPNMKDRNSIHKMISNYKKMKICDRDIFNILKSVNIMTPENIHLNSFMYEPILDMDIVELKGLYEDVESNLS